MCTSLGVTPSIEPCCAASTPRACFSDYVAGKSITYPKPTGPTGAESTVTSVDSNSVACASVYSISSQCVASTPDWNDLDFSSQLSCVCYTSGTFAPQVWDGYWSTCLAWISTANPSEYSLVGPTGGGIIVRTPRADYPTNSGAFPSTALPPTPGVSLTAVSGTVVPSNTKSSAGSKLKLHLGLFPNCDDLSIYVNVSLGFITPTNKIMTFTGSSMVSAFITHVADLHLSRVTFQLSQTSYRIMFYRQSPGLSIISNKWMMN